MRRDKRRQDRRSGAAAPSARARSRPASLPAVEPLEGRQLLSLYLGPTKSRPLFSGHAFYQITLTGPGYQTVSSLGQGHHRIIAINLTGTTSQSQLNITQKSTQTGFGTANTALQIGKIDVQSGQLGAINAVGTADLLGAITPLKGGAQSIGFNSLGPNAQINVLGSLGTFQVGSAKLSANGQVHIAGDVTGTFSVGSLNLDGGKMLIDHNASGGLSLGGLSIEHSGQFVVGNDVSGTSSLGAVNIDGGRFLVTHDVAAGSSLTTGNLLVQNSGQLVVGNDASGVRFGGPAKILNNGLFQVGGNLNGLSAGILTVDSSGRLLVGHDAIGPITLGTVTVQNGGQFNIGHDVTGVLQITGAAKINTKGQIQVGDNLGGLSVGQDLTLDSSGRLIVGNDVTGPITVASGVNLSNNAQLSVGRDVLSAVTITGDVRLDSGGSLAIGRNLSSLSINGDLRFTPSAGTVAVLGNVGGLTINGIYQGRGNTSTASPELIVGLDLTNLTVLGGAAAQGSIENANIAVAKNIVGLNVPHGIFNSLVTAGVVIDGSSQSSSPGGNIGPDGTDSVFDSQILAGLQIKNFVVNGDVRSDYVTNPRPNPTGYRTRIVAGEDRQGNFVSGGNIDNFQITGSLIDAVLAASVQPNGGDGTLPPTGYGANRTQATAQGDGGFNTYDAPAGVIVGGTFGAPIPFPNFTEVSYTNETFTGVAYNQAIDPTIDDNILPGAINPSFASPPAPTSVTTTLSTTGNQSINSSTGPSVSSSTGQSTTATTTVTTTNLALPTKSTVLGGVISTSHGNNPDANDFAGIFAADTRGVFVGVLPQKTTG